MMRLVFLFLLVFAAAAPAKDHAREQTVEKLLAAMNDPGRPEEERAREAQRKPVETLMFFGLSEDMHVIELFPGQGWYTRLLSPVLAENGKLYTALRTARMGELLEEVPDFDIISMEARTIPTRTYGIYKLKPFDFGVSDIDMILTFRNLHNLTAEGRSNLFAAVVTALKKGGRMGVVDHTRRHMEPQNVENRRRVDPVDVIGEANAAGLVLIGHSDLHYMPDDALRFEVGRRSVAGYSDRFTLLFEKPR